MSTSVGNQAEDAAARHLSELGYEVLSRNWRTPVCEIDIVAGKGDVIYFVEVKYRSSQNQGGGLEYITAKKLQQMRFAAQCWVEDQKWTGDFRLSAVSVLGDFVVDEFIADIV